MLLVQKLHDADLGSVSRSQVEVLAPVLGLGCEKDGPILPEDVVAWDEV